MKTYANPIGSYRGTRYERKAGTVRFKDPVSGKTTKVGSMAAFRRVVDQAARGAQSNPARGNPLRANSRRTDHQVRLHAATEVLQAALDRAHRDPTAGALIDLAQALGIYEAEYRAVHERPSTDLLARHAAEVLEIGRRARGTTKGMQRPLVWGAKSERKNPRPRGRRHNPRQRKPRAYRVQAFLLDADHFTLPRARKWLDQWGHRSDDITLRRGEYVAVQYDAGDFVDQTLHTIGIAKHVDGRIGLPLAETEAAAGRPRVAKAKKAKRRTSRRTPVYVPDAEYGF